MVTGIAWQGRIDQRLNCCPVRPLELLDCRKSATVKIVGDRLDSKNDSPPPVVEGNNCSPATANEFSAGAIFDEKYQILQFLGAGGFSRVYKARHIYLKKTVAIKILHSECAADEEKRQRLTREARTISSLAHPNIVGLHDFGYSNGRPYLVMDYVEGASLAEILKNGKRFSIDECLQIASQACAALSLAHLQGIIHRDLKPANIMLVSDPDSQRTVVKLLDFGLAKAVQQYGADSLMAKTQTGEVLGTPAYMSPEQCQGHQLDERSDLYSLGCVIYELLVGEKPFDAETPLAAMLQHINEPPRTFSQAARLRKISPALESAVLRALAKRPQDRYKSAAEFSNELMKAGSGRQNLLTSTLNLLRSRLSAKRHDLRLGAIILLAVLWAGTFVLDHFTIVPRWIELKQAALSQMYDERMHSLKALETIKAAVSAMEQAGAPRQEIALMRNTLGDCTFVMGRTDEARQYYKQSIKDAEASGDRLTLVISLNHYARCLSFLRLYETALETSRRAVALAAGLPLEDKRHLRDNLMTLGAILYNRNNSFGEAEAAMNQAWAVESELNGAKENKRKAIIAFELSKILLAENKLSEAEKMFKKSAGISRRLFGSGAPSILLAQQKEYDELLNMKAPRFKPEYAIVHYSFIQTRRH
jgi:serine/threonine protein kinase